MFKLAYLSTKLVKLSDKSFTYLIDLLVSAAELFFVRVGFEDGLIFVYKFVDIFSLDEQIIVNDPQICEIFVLWFDDGKEVLNLLTFLF